MGTFLNTVNKYFIDMKLMSTVHVYSSFLFFYSFVYWHVVVEWQAISDTALAHLVLFCFVEEDEAPQLVKMKV